MAFKFLRIVAANAEIDRQAAEIASLTKERDVLKAAMEVNSADTIKALEDSQARVAALEAAQKALADEKDTIKTELDMAKAELAAAPVKISVKAAEITAAQGQPPIATTSAGTPAGGAAGIIEQWQAIADPRAKTEFYRKNKAAIDAAWKPTPQKRSNH